MKIKSRLIIIPVFLILLSTYLNAAEKENEQKEQAAKWSESSYKPKLAPLLLMVEASTYLKEGINFAIEHPTQTVILSLSSLVNTVGATSPQSSILSSTVGYVWGNAPYIVATMAAAYGMKRLLPVIYNAMRWHEGMPRYSTFQDTHFENGAHMGFLISTYPDGRVSKDTWKQASDSFAPLS